MVNAKKKNKYTKNFLDSVLLKIDFSNNQLSGLSNFSDSIRELFPIQTNSEFNTEIIPSSDLEHNNASMVWNFKSLNEMKEIEVHSTYIILAYNKGGYVNFTDMYSDYKKIVDIFFEKNDINITQRIGLRFINNINLNNLKSDDICWSDYIHKSLIPSLFDNKILKNNKSRIFSNTFFTYDDYILQFKYGIWNKDFPSVNTRKEFVLDFDCYSKYPINKNEIDKTIKEYNKKIETLFEKCINKKLREIMNS